jgi:PAS domain S-box-containing protein
MNTMTASIVDTERLLASVGVGMWLWDGDLLRLQMDPVCKAFFELDLDQEPQQNILDEKIVAEDLESYRLAIQACKESGKFACEFRVRRAVGGFRYLSGRGHTVNQREATFFIQGVFIDVTATKELENRLKNTQSRMQELVDGIPGLFSYIDQDYRVWFMSSQYRDIFKREANALVGVHIRDLIGEQMFAERKPRYDEALSGTEVHYESSRSMRDGSTAFFSVTHKPFRDENGDIIGVMTLGIDVTERRKMEQAIEAKSEELQRSNKDLEQFAYVASHDLKAPLRAIEVIIEWLRDDLEEFQGGDVHENLNLLSQRTGRLARLLDDLLAYSRAGRKIGDVRTVDMREFVQDIATLLAPPEGFQIFADESLPVITVHHAPLETVLRNLISNAIKHHPNPQEGMVRVYAQDQGDSVLFSVEDNGEGIPEQYAERVFQMFQTLKPRDDTEGSGMGLAIVQRIVHWQNGKVWLTSGSDGKGTTFKFTWNKVPTAMPAIQEDASDDQYQDEASKNLIG